MPALKNQLTEAVVAATALPIAAQALARTELSSWSWRQEDVAACGEIIEAFDAEHPDISVTYTAHEAKAYNTILTTDLTPISSIPLRMAAWKTSPALAIWSRLTFLC